MQCPGKAGRGPGMERQGWRRGLLGTKQVTTTDMQRPCEAGSGSEVAPKRKCRSLFEGALAEAAGRGSAQDPPSAEQVTRVAALRGVALFQRLGDDDVEEAARHLERATIERGDYVLRQGEAGSALFVVEQGDCVAEVDGAVVCSCHDEGCFGEHALLRKEPWAASVRVTSPTLACYRMSREVFGSLTGERMKSLFKVMVEAVSERNTTLDKIHLFTLLSNQGMQAAAKSLELVTFNEGDLVLRQGDKGGDFFMIQSGECTAEVDGTVVSRYNGEGHFGGRAISCGEPQAASVRATSASLACFRMSRRVFQQLMADKKQQLSKRSLLRSVVDLTQLRRQALRQVKLFRSLNNHEIELAVKAIDVVSFKRGDYVVRQGEQGNEFFMVDAGECVVEVDDKIVSTYTKGGYFGERALLHDEPRAASIKVTSDTLTCFQISQKVFKNLMEERIKALRGVKLFNSFNSHEIQEAAEALEVAEYEEGDYVIRQHEQGSDFFMVISGECVVEVDGAVVFKYSNGGSFGERALLHDEPRAASIKVTSETLVCFRMAQEVFKKIMLQRIKALREVKLLQSFGQRELTEAAEALELVSFEKGDYVMRQGEKGDEFFIIDSGECVAEVNGTVVHRYSDEGSFGERALLRDEPRAASIRVTSDALSCFRISQQDFKAIISDRNNKERLIKQCSFLETMPDEQVAILAGAFRRVRYPVRVDAPPIIQQGALTDENSCFYLLEKGECVAYILQPDGSQQEVKSYRTGEVFGEKALMESKPRAASIMPRMITRDSSIPVAGAAILDGELAEQRRDCKIEVVVLELSRAEFEKQLGSPMSQLQAKQYNSDPRKLLADFYRKGDRHGPSGSRRPKKAGDHTSGTIPAQNRGHAAAGLSSWFAVYRPCSKDSIAKMIGKAGVGKGLNVKGKSAKMNRLSGFVPFVQISDNAHKNMVEPPSTSPAYDIHVYLRSAANREEAKAALEACLEQMVIPEGETVAPSPIRLLTGYEEGSSEPSFGLAVPEFLFMEFYVLRPDLSPLLGWETGRPSQPAFLNMNLHSVRWTKDGTPPSNPSACLYQFDKGDPLNPFGLLVAYAEERHVKPVVSDFDTFLVGSCGANPFDDLVDEQRALILWLLRKTEQVLLDEKDGIGDEKFNWTCAWLKKVMSEEAMEKDNFQIPPMPKFGFGDPTSYQLTCDVVKKLLECGAVRHGAECFNYGFPQELDEEFLVIWDRYESLTGKPWEMLNEKELLKFLTDRLQEDFVFPLNPVWMIRDGKNGWSQLFELMLCNEHIREQIQCWYDKETIAKIRDLSQKVMKRRIISSYRRRLTSSLALSHHVQDDGTISRKKPPKIVTIASKHAQDNKSCSRSASSRDVGTSPLLKPPATHFVVEEDEERYQSLGAVQEEDCDEEMSEITARMARAAARRR